MNKAEVIQLTTREARLKRKLREHFRKIGFTRDASGLLVPPTLDKDGYRQVHLAQRTKKIRDNAKWVAAHRPQLKTYFASGSDIEVASIRPRLEMVTGSSREGDLFRLASLSWRIPVSEGYGRRLRFLVWDDNNGKLIGLIALGDAVFNLKARDDLIGWDHHRRKEALVHMMDAYVLGAIPPYNSLLGGKLVASLVRTSEVRDCFDAKYRNSVGVISGESKRARLVAVTTTSALGRSSVYNRLTLKGNRIFSPIGFTSGWGHFHISEGLFSDLREYMIHIGDPSAIAFDFGQGPNWRIRLIKRALTHLGMNPDLLQHGMTRELFFCRVATNAMPFLNGNHVRVSYGDLPSVDEVSELAKDRWMIPRAERRPDYKIWNVQDFVDSLSQPIPLTPPSSNYKGTLG